MNKKSIIIIILFIVFTWISIGIYNTHTIPCNNEVFQLKIERENLDIEVYQDLKRNVQFVQDSPLDVKHEMYKFYNGKIKKCERTIDSLNVLIKRNDKTLRITKFPF